VSAANWVSLVALSGWLILMFGAYRAHRLGGRKTLTMALGWTAIFLLVTGIIASVSGTEMAPP